MDRNGLRRRAVLHSTATASLFALAGCISDGNMPETDQSAANETDGGDGTEADATEDGSGENGETDADLDTPEGTVRAFFTSFTSGDADEINAFIHDEAPIDEIGHKEATEMEETGPRLQSVENIEENGDEAAVEVRATSEDVENWGEGPQPFVVQLRTQDGEWRVWNIHPPGEDGTPTDAPQVAFDVASDGSTLEIRHEGGDAVSPSELYIRGDGIEATGSWAELGGGTSTNADGDPVVTAGNSVTVESESEYNITIVWESDGDSVTLAAMGGARETGSESAGERNEVERHLADTDNFDGTVADFTGEDEAVVQVGELDESDQPFGFSPPAIRVDPGTTVRWEWQGDVAHTVTAVDDQFDSGVHDGDGKTFSVTFEESGTSLYYCTPHRALGAKGAVVVTES